MMLTDMWLKHPALVVTVQYLFLILCACVALTSGFFDYADQNTREFLIWDEPTTIAYDKLTVAEEFL